MSSTQFSEFWVGFGLVLIGYFQLTVGPNRRSAIAQKSGISGLTKNPDRNLAGPTTGPIAGPLNGPNAGPTVGPEILGPSKLMTDLPVVAVSTAPVVDLLLDVGLPLVTKIF